MIMIKPTLKFLLIPLLLQATPFFNSDAAGLAVEKRIKNFQHLRADNTTLSSQRYCVVQGSEAHSSSDISKKGSTSLSQSTEIEQYEMKIHKSFYAGDYYGMFDSIEGLLLKYPENPEAFLYCYELARLTDVYGCKRVVETLNRIISSIEKSKGFEERNISLLILKLELERLLYRYNRDEAVKLSGKLYPLRRWLLLGPYKRYGNSDLDYAFMPEITTRLDFSGLKKKRINVKNPRGFVDMKRRLYPEEGIAYAVTTIDHPKPIKIRLYSNSAYKLFINGRQVVTNVKGKTFRNYRIIRVWGAPSKTIMIKLLKSDSWAFRVLVTDDMDRIINPSCDPNKMVFSDFKHIEQMDYPFEHLMDRAGIDEGEAYLRLGSFFYELGSREAIEFYRKSLSKEESYLTLYLLASSMIDFSNGERDSSFYTEGWQIMTRLASKHPDFIPAQHKRFQRLIQRRSILQAYFEGKALLDKADSFLPLRLDFIDLLIALGYDKEFEEEIISFMKSFPSSSSPLKMKYKFYRNKDINKVIDLCKRILEGEHSKGYLGRLISIYSKHGRYAEGIELIKRHDHEGDFTKKLIDMYINSNNFAKAKRVIFQEMVKKDDPFFNLKLGHINFIQDVDPTMYWKKALAVDPSLFTLNDYLYYIAEREMKNPLNEHKKDRFIDHILSWGLSDLEGASSAIIHRGMIFILNNDGSSRVYCEDIIHVGDEQGIKRWGEYAVHFRGDFHPLRIRVFNNNGNFSDSYRISKINGTNYINLASLKKESIAHISYYIDNPIMEPRGSLFFVTPFTLIHDFNQPILHFSTQVITPRNMELDFSFNRDLQISSEEIDDSLIYSLKLANCSKIIREKNMGSSLNYLPYFAFSTMKGLKDLIYWYNSLLVDAFHIDPNELKDRFKGKSISDVAGNVYEYVSRDIDLRSNLLFYPEKARNTLYKKSGTVEDKVILAKAILDVLGIRSFIALAKRDDLPNFGSFITPYAFSNILLYVPIDEKSGIWMDFSNQYIHCGAVNDSIADTDAVVMIGDNYEIKKIDEYGSDSTVADFLITLDNRGNAQYNIKMDFYGKRGNIREHFRNNIYNEDVINFYIGRIIPSISIDEYGIDNFRNYKDPFEIWVKGDSFTLATMGKNKMILQPILKRSKIYDYVRYAERKHPLIITSGIEERDKYVYILPPEFHSFEADENHIINSIFGSAKIQIKKAKGTDTLLITKEVRVTKSKIMPSQYNKFLEFCLKLKKIELRNITIKKG